MRRIVLNKDSDVIDHIKVRPNDTILVYDHKNICQGTLINMDDQWRIVSGSIVNESFINSGFESVIKFLLTEVKWNLKVVDNLKERPKTVIYNTDPTISINDVKADSLILVYKNGQLVGTIVRNDDESWEFRSPTKVFSIKYSRDKLVTNLVNDGYTLRIH